MIETKIPEINVDELMEKIRAEVKKRKEKGQTPHRTVPHASNGSPSNFSAKVDFSKICGLPEPEPFEIKDNYHIHDFSKYHGRNFVTNVYRGVLKRDPDSYGLQHFLGKLNSGQLTKTEVVGRLRYCREGRPKKTKIRGLFWPFLIQSSFKIPILGYLFRIMVGIANFPAILRNLQVLEENTFTQLQQQRNDLSKGLIQLGMDLEKKVYRDELEVGLERKADREELEVGLERKAGRGELETINKQVCDILRQTKDFKLNILDQQRRLMFFLEEARKKLPEPISTDRIQAMLAEEDQVLNSIYVSFEDQFRGTSENIKERQRVYLPYLEKAGLGDENSPVLDVGCGRGEWLELLKEKGYKARGVDLNSLMIEKCKAKKLDVVNGDAVDFLRDLKNNSIGMITGFHIVEHLSMRKMISFFDEALRVVKPGGIVIFETPNPENVLVGSCTFYSDPTHKNPIPPDTLKFLLENRGFISSDIVRLNPLNLLEYNKEDPLRDLIYRFNMAQDYAMITRKAV